MSELATYTPPEVILILDLETLAADTDNAVIWWTCLIGYDVAKEEIIPVRHDQFYPIQPQLDKGRLIEADTMLFWMDQADEVRKLMKECASQDPSEITSLLVNFSTMFEAMVAGRSYELYANSPSFDCNKLKSLFRDWGFDAPWDFRRERCLRTLAANAGIDQYSVPKVPGFIKHHAYHDCRQELAIYKAARGIGVE